LKEQLAVQNNNSFDGIFPAAVLWVEVYAWHDFLYYFTESLESNVGMSQPKRAK